MLRSESSEENMAKIVIIGASNSIGVELFVQALRRGHSVTAVLRNQQEFTRQQENKRAVIGPAVDQEVLNRAVAGQDIVCWTLGIKPTSKPVTAFSEDTQCLLRAMKNANVRRLICVTGIGGGDSRGHGGFFYDRIINPLLLRTIYEDKDRQENLIKASDTDWIIVRPGFLTDGPLTQRYRVHTDLTGVTARKISRADVAHFILENIGSREYVGKTPLLTY
jgi:putative NADH-flavin reductase